MTPSKALLATLVLLPLAAACGSSDKSTVSSASSPSATVPSTSASSPADDGNGDDGYRYPSSSDTSATTLKLRTSKLGTYLTDANGRTLYLFERDRTNESRCSGACAAAWPPVAATSVGAGLKASLLKQITRSDGMKQSSYAGHPLYYYAGDTNPGDTHGQGLDQFGAEWYVLDKNGKKIDSD